MSENEERRLAPQPVERRTFLRYGLMGATSAGLGGFALSSLGLLWPRLGEGFFGEAALGDAKELAEDISSNRAPMEIAEAKISVVLWDPSVSVAARNYGDDHQAVIDDSTALMAVDSFNCPHLGCKVPWCQSSQWFECPCHGSRYNRWGEWTGGPAPRGFDRYPSSIDENTGQFVVDLSNKLTGPARTANALEQPPEGPACVDV